MKTPEEIAYELVTIHNSRNPEYPYRVDYLAVAREESGKINYEHKSFKSHPCEDEQYAQRYANGLRDLVILAINESRNGE
jgi:hypothetical protein